MQQWLGTLVQSQFISVWCADMKPDWQYPAIQHARFVPIGGAC
jgi:hypothetical protein